MDGKDAVPPCAASLSRRRAAGLLLRRLLGYIVERYTTTFAAAVATAVTSAFCPYSLRTKGAQEEVSILFM